MIKKSRFIKLFVFTFFCLGIILFYLWSKQILISILLYLILDSFTYQIIKKKINASIPKKFHHLLKAVYVFCISVGLIIFLRVFFLDFYYIPSNSMERTLLPGNYVIINKFHYGTKLPKLATDLPIIGHIFKKRNAKHQYDLYHTLRVFKKFNREDIVVFKSVEDNNQFLIKRIIGLPGDTIHIEKTQTYINNIIIEDKPKYCYSYIDTTQSSSVITYSNKEYYNLSFDKKQDLNKDLQTTPNPYYIIFPESKQQKWSRDNYGKLWIPKKGQQILLTKENIELYGDLIKHYEDEFIIFSDNEIKQYTFKKNYYFMIGDNRHNSIDSRNYGFVPDSYIQGKMILKF